MASPSLHNDVYDAALAELRDDPAQEIKAIARAVRRLCRKVENLHDGVD